MSINKVRTFLSLQCLTALAILMAALSSCINDPEEEEWSLAPGDPLPEFTVTTTDGRTVSNLSFAGRKGAIIFFSTECVDCRRELPQLEEEYRRLLSEPGGEDFELICISREETADRVNAFWTEHALTMPVAIETGRYPYSLFATSGIPRIYLIDNGLITSLSFTGLLQ